MFTSKFYQDLQSCYIVLIFRALTGCLSGLHCLFRWLQERAAPSAWISFVIQKKKKVLQKYLLCKLFILMPRVKTISTKWKNPATSFLGVKVSWERVLNSYLQITQSFKRSSWTKICHHILRACLVTVFKNCCLKRCENCSLKVLLKYMFLVFIKQKNVFGIMV